MAEPRWQYLCMRMRDAGVHGLGCGLVHQSVVSTIVVPIGQESRLEVISCNKVWWKKCYKMLRKEIMKNADEEAVLQNLLSNRVICTFAHVKDDIQPRFASLAY